MMGHGCHSVTICTLTPALRQGGGGALQQQLSSLPAHQAAAPAQLHGGIQAVTAGMHSKEEARTPLQHFNPH